MNTPVTIANGVETIDVAQLLRERDEWRARCERMQQDAQRKVSLKVSEKGAVALYGLGRFPVTLYRSQWERVIEAVKSGQVERFIEANAALLSVKA